MPIRRLEEGRDTPNTSKKRPQNKAGITAQQKAVNKIKEGEQNVAGFLKKEI
ncbi:hypothetical protein AGMMS49949_05330 [Alphaproteobacteria bacterium]|nr:hypothetical protein AGMMS49949_05330 [Alphaproteobacteria bacterium]